MTASTERPAATERRRLLVSGVVQGVGFRPHVHRLASELGLAGFVVNDSAGVLVETQGDVGALDRFEARLVSEAPPLAVVNTLQVSRVEPRNERSFRIEASRGGGQVRTVVPPDIACCDDCLAELFEPTDRRYRYPFVNCTNCGPRFTIITALPYDRVRTTMAGFPLCEACAVEYADPTNRRFHAEPVACPRCGPTLAFGGPGVRVEPPEQRGACGGGSDRALALALAALGEGQILAVKGVGGYHLACDAGNEAAVSALRARKGRGDKPFAVMVPDLATARRLATVSPAEAAALSSPARPIVLLERLRGGAIASLVAPGNHRIGLFLPYSPLHHLLFAAVPGAAAVPPQALVMTSGNAGEEPIAYEDGDAAQRLARLADAFLVHDRPITRPCDDSVVALDGQNVLPIRRSRGYAPLPVRLPFPLPPLVATGGELKNTACVTRGDEALLSQHLGDMGSPQTLEAARRSIDSLQGLYGIVPRCVVADTHPGYHSRRVAEERAERDGLVLELVQHHHAHVAAVMAEHGVPRDEAVVGIAFDGTGYGDDGAVWGGEVLLATYERAERVAHLSYLPLPGGDAAVRKPYRFALAALRSCGIEWTEDLAPVRAASPDELAVLATQLDRNVACVPSSSMGRLFDAVASLAGLAQVAGYEAQAAIELEGAAIDFLAGGGADSGAPYRFGLEGGTIDPTGVICSAVSDLRAGAPAGAVAARFHNAVAAMVAEVASDCAARTGTTTVALCGGVFQNLLLVRLARAALVERGLNVLTHRVVPPNDGGLSLGQAVVGAARAAQREQDRASDDGGRERR